MSEISVTKTDDGSYLSSVAMGRFDICASLLRVFVKLNAQNRELNT